MDTPDTIYLIMAGVRRCVAAREAGLDGLSGHIQHAHGHTLGYWWVPFDRLVSPKSAVARYGRSWDFDGLIEAMKSEAGRTRVPLLTFQPISPRAAARRTPLLDVVLRDDDEEDEQ